MLTLAERTRFWSRVTKTESCWHFKPRSRCKSYPTFKTSGKQYTVHRLSWLLAHGELPPQRSGLVIDHLCRNLCCVRPDHLELVTIAENVRRGLHCQKYTGAILPTCPKGHGLEHVYIGRFRSNKSEPWKDGLRCRECSRERKRLQRAREIERHLAAGGTVGRTYKIVCKAGHALVGDNVYGPKRQCKECRRMRVRESRARQRDRSINSRPADLGQSQ